MVLSAAAALVWAAARAGAVPPYQRLFESKYRYRPNCSACHDRDSWELNPYGRDFYPTRRDAAALATIEGRDPDGDKTASGAEIASRANPGERRSTPERLGDWLERVLEPAAPKRDLLALFPAADEFAYRERSVSARERGKIEKRLGRPLEDVDLFPTYFEVTRKGTPLGIALYSASLGESSCAFLAGYRKTPEGWRVAGLRLLSCASWRFRSPDFLAQFKDKDPEGLRRLSPPVPQLARPAKGIAEAVQNGAAVLEEIAR